VCVCVCVFSAKAKKSVADIKSEIRAILLQVTASVSFLPLLQEPCTFELLVSIDKEAPVPSEWETSDPKYIDNAQIVKLRSFSTTVHQVDSIVAFKADEC
jgi:mitotic spindle assembly checkpoint protein MAD2